MGMTFKPTGERRLSQGYGVKLLSLRPQELGVMWRGIRRKTMSPEWEDPLQRPAM
jgi:hypothetical protein